MAYTEQDRVYIRHYVGFGAIFLQAEPRLENAILATQSLSENGTRPDSSTENFIKAMIYGSVAVIGPPAIPAVRGLLTLDATISGLDIQSGALEVGRGQVRIDSARETARLRSEGRRMAHALARMLGMRGVRADMFSAAPVVMDADPFASDATPFW